MKKLLTFSFIICLSIALIAFVPRRAIASNLTFRSQSTNSNVGGNLSVNATAGVADGDLLVANFLAGNASAVTPTLGAPAGWTLIGVQGTQSLLAGGFSIRYGTYYKIASGEGASYTVTSNSTSVTQAAIVDYDNPDLVSPLDASSTAQFTGSATPVATALTTAQNNELDMTIFWGPGAGAGVTWTPPGGMTERVDFNSVGINDVNQVSAGTTGTKTATASVSGDGFWVHAVFKSEPQLKQFSQF